MTNSFALYFCRNNKKPPEQANLQRWFEDGNRVVPILPVCTGAASQAGAPCARRKSKSRARCMIYSDDARVAGKTCSLAILCLLWPSGISYDQLSEGSRFPHLSGATQTA